MSDDSTTTRPGPTPLVCPERLLPALGAVALQVQRARTIEGIFEAVGTGLRRLGLTVIAFELTADGLQIRYHNLDVEMLRTAGLPDAAGLLMPLTEGSNLHRATLAVEPLFFEQALADSVGYLAKHRPELLGKVQQVVHLSGCARTVNAPLFVNTKRWGVLGVGANELCREHLPAIGLFAGLVGSAIEVADTISRLEQRNRELERAQVVLVRRERLAALGELSAVMAHEMRNPLGVIFNSLTSLKRMVKGDGDGEMLLRIVEEESDRLNRIVGDLLDFARPYEAERKPIALEPVIASAVAAATQTVPGHKVTVVTEVGDELPRFVMDGHLVRQAMVNLLVNAIQAMPRGGTVTVRVGAEKKDGHAAARIEVRDEGVGISSQAAGKIFQPFFTTKATGTGLGLAVVKRIVDAHHGEIVVRPVDGGGTSFTMLLPEVSIDANA